MFEEQIIMVDGSQSRSLEMVPLEDLGLQEREHLQEWVMANPDVLGEGSRIITSEFDKFQAADGTVIRDRLDVLAIDPSGRLVVAELKRGTAPPTAHMQALNYAALMSRFAIEEIASMIAEARPEIRAALGVPDEVAGITEMLITQFGMTVDSIRSPRVVLLASDFPPAMTATVVWLNEQGIDFSLVRLRAYRLGNDGVVVSFARVFPVPDAEEFTVGRRSGDPRSESDDAPAWDRASLELLASKANSGTLALMDLVACSPAGRSVTFAEVCEFAGMSSAQARGQLAGFTMILRNPGFDGRSKWPATVKWSATGAASYSMPDQLSQWWREVRGLPNPVTLDAS